MSKINAPTQLWRVPSKSNCLSTPLELMVVPPSIYANAPQSSHLRCNTPHCDACPVTYHISSSSHRQSVIKANVKLDV
jgi:hypothetical protein